MARGDRLHRHSGHGPPAALTDASPWNLHLSSASPWNLRLSDTSPWNLHVRVLSLVCPPLVHQLGISGKERWNQEALQTCRIWNLQGQC